MKQDRPVESIRRPTRQKTLTLTRSRRPTKAPPLELPSVVADALQVQARRLLILGLSAHKNQATCSSIRSSENELIVQK